MDKPDTSVVIPTRNRPDDLRRALTSVAHQDAIPAVAEVVVIENSTNHASREVCKEFGDLPIKWLHNEPPLPMSAWANRVFRSAQPDSEFFALLCDDDWWYPSHLGQSRRALLRSPDRVAAWSRVVEYNERLMTGFPRGHALWLVTDHRMEELEVTVSLKEMLVANLLTTATHVSGFVGRQSAIQAVLPGVCNGNPFDIDRHLAVLLATNGLSVFLTAPTVGVRQHHQQESRTLGATNEAREWWRMTTREIIDISQKHGIDLGRELSELAARRPGCFATLVGNAYFDGVAYVGTVTDLPSSLRAARRRYITASWLKRLFTPAALRVIGMRRWVDEAAGQSALA
jgi:glycosyltransferase involved in cell wall biosynthesis